MEDKPQRQIKHMEIVYRLANLDSAVQEVWELVYKVNPGLTSPKATVEVMTEPGQLSLSEFFMMLPERISAVVGSVREATETLEKELF